MIRQQHFCRKTHLSESQNYMAKKKHRNPVSHSPSLPPEVPSKHCTNIFRTNRMVLLFAGLVALVFVIYSGSLNGPFIFDDMNHIEYNPAIRLERLTIDGLKKAALESPATLRPVANLSFALNHYLHGQDTFGYHLLNVAIHAAAGIFLYLFIGATLYTPALRSKYENRKWLAFIATAIWLVHPLGSQSVTYIVQRMNSLAAMFFVIAMLCYARGRLAETGTNRWLWWGCCAAAGLLACGSKQIAATLPFFIFLYEWYFFQNLSRDWLRRRILPLAGVLILFGTLSLVYLGADPLGRILGDYGSRDFTMLQRVLTQLRVVIFYISLLVFPHPSRLNLDRDFALSNSFIDPITTLLCMAAIAGLLFLAWRLAAKQRLASFCILWFLGNLAIESSVIALEIIFDHRTYLPSMLAFLPAIAVLAPRLRLKWTAIGVLAAVLALFSLWTYERNAVFRDQIALWGDCVAKSPEKPRPHNNLGIFLKRNGRIDEAIAHFQKALELKRDYASPHINLAGAYGRQGKHEKALVHFDEALRLRPNVPETHYGMGNALAAVGRIAEAVDHYRKALEIKPDYADAHLKLADVLDQKGRQQEAIEHYQEALRLNPDYVQAHNNLGVTLASQGQLEAAIRHFTKVLQMRPKDAEAHFNMGNARANQGRYQEAAAYFAKALQINPKDREARSNLEKVQQMMKDNGNLRSDAGRSRQKSN